MTTTTTKTASRTTMTAIQRGKFSTAFSVLLLCAALLLTKSGAVLALSGDGNAELAAQVDAWSETTTVGEGSGWEITIISTDQPEYTTTEGIDEVDTTTVNAEIPNEGGVETTAPADAETTLSPNEPEQETTVQPIQEQPTSGPNEEQSSSSPSGEQSTSSPSDLPSSTGPNEEQSSPSPNEQPSTSGPNQEQPSSSDPSQEQPTSSDPNQEQSSTSGPNQEQSSSGPSEEQPTTTEAEPIITTIAPTPPAPPVFVCQTAGLFPHISGACHLFHNCLLDTLSGELRAFEMQCPPPTTFSPSYGRCVRDLAECANDAFVCPSYGRFAGSDDTYYYNCVPSVRGGFHKYIVRCSAGQRFEPLLGRCWRFDWTQLPGQALEASDLAAIKREQKELKAEEKLRKKAEKNLEKEARKQQKLEEKLAKKAAKEQAKKEAKANKPLSVESAESLEQSSFGV